MARNNPSTGNEIKIYGPSVMERVEWHGTRAFVKNVLFQRELFMFDGCHVTLLDCEFDPECIIIGENSIINFISCIGEKRKASIALAHVQAEFDDCVFESQLGGGCPYICAVSHGSTVNFREVLLKNFDGLALKASDSRIEYNWSLMSANRGISGDGAFIELNNANCEFVDTDLYNPGKDRGGKAVVANNGSKVKFFTTFGNIHPTSGKLVNGEGIIDAAEETFVLDKSYLEVRGYSLISSHHKQIAKASNSTLILNHITDKIEGKLTAFELESSVLKVSNTPIVESLTDKIVDGKFSKVVFQNVDEAVGKTDGIVGESMAVRLIACKDIHAETEYVLNLTGANTTLVIDQTDNIYSPKGSIVNDAKMVMDKVEKIESTEATCLTMENTQLQANRVVEFVGAENGIVATSGSIDIENSDSIIGTNVDAINGTETNVSINKVKSIEGMNNGIVLNSTKLALQNISTIHGELTAGLNCTKCLGYVDIVETISGGPIGLVVDNCRELVLRQVETIFGVEKGIHNINSTVTTHKVREITSSQTGIRGEANSLTTIDNTINIDASTTAIDIDSSTINLINVTNINGSTTGILGVKAAIIATSVGNINAATALDLLSKSTLKMSTIDTITGIIKVDNSTLEILSIDKAESNLELVNDSVTNINTINILDGNISLQSSHLHIATISALNGNLTIDAESNVTGLRWSSITGNIEISTSSLNIQTYNLEGDLTLSDGTMQLANGMINGAITAELSSVHIANSTIDGAIQTTSSVININNATLEGNVQAEASTIIMNNVEGTTVNLDASTAQLAVSTFDSITATSSTIINSTSELGDVTLTSSSHINATSQANITGDASSLAQLTSTGDVTLTNGGIIKIASNSAVTLENSGVVALGSTGGNDLSSSGAILCGGDESNNVSSATLGLAADGTSGCCGGATRIAYFCTDSLMEIRASEDMDIRCGATLTRTADQIIDMAQKITFKKGGPC